MSAEVIQARYELLDQAAIRFGRQAEVQQQLTRTIRQVADILIEGSWQGQGVAAFAAELNDTVLPAMRRLSDALLDAQSATQQMAAILHAAEEEASRPFRGDATMGTTGAADSPDVARSISNTGMRPTSDSLVVRSPSQVLSESYMEASIGARFRGENQPELNRHMEELLDVSRSDPSKAGPLLDKIADLRGEERAAFRAQYQTYLQLMENAYTKGGDYPTIDLDRHPNFVGSTVSLRYGKVVGDVFGLDPVFGALLNPTGGLVGPGSTSYMPSADDAIGYHGVFHDAAGYLYNHHGLGPGYDYLGRDFIDTSSPLSGQFGGISWWMAHPKLEVDVLPNIMPDIPWVPEFVERGIGEAVEGGIVSTLRPIAVAIEEGGDIIDGIGDVFQGDFDEGLGDITKGAVGIAGGAARSVIDYFD